MNWNQLDNDNVFYSANDKLGRDGVTRLVRHNTTQRLGGYNAKPIKIISVRRQSYPSFNPMVQLQILEKKKKGKLLCWYSGGIYSHDGLIIIGDWI